AQAAAQQAASAAAVAATVGGAGAGAAATASANQAAASAASQSGSGGSTGSSGSGSSGGSSSPPATTIAASGSSTAAGQAAVQAAQSQLGVPYAWGGESPGHGFDCSGLTQWAWAQAGVSIPRTAAAQYSAIPHVSLTALQPGDLLFYKNLDTDGIIDHVVMYVGSGPYGSNTIIQAPSTGRTVSYSPMYYTDLIGAGRP
ncbi:MAG TPA: C40 family peptidase, partial [Acidimicrobiales bacterium]|nr:C40 family peptidase [Acidimicrobiales bacterium]